MVQKAVQRGRSKVCGAKHNERHACARRREDEREQCLARTMLGPCFSVLRRLLGLFAGLEALGALFQVGNAMGAAEMPVAQAAQHEAHFDSILCLAAVTIFCGSCLRHGPSPLNVRRFDRSASVAEHVEPGALYLATGLVIHCRRSARSLDGYGFVPPASLSATGRTAGRTSIHERNQARHLGRVSLRRLRQREVYSSFVSGHKPG